MHHIQIKDYENSKIKLQFRYTKVSITVFCQNIFHQNKIISIIIVYYGTISHVFDDAKACR